MHIHRFFWRSHGPGTDLWPHAYASWPHRMTSNPQINFKAVLIFIDLAQLYFCLAYRNSHWAFIDCHTPVTLQLGEDKILIYPIKIEFWPNTSYFLIKSHFSDCSLLFDTPGTVKEINFHHKSALYASFLNFGISEPANF